MGLALGLRIPVTHMALVVAPPTAGGPVAVATAVVLTFRISTVRLPLLPGASALGAPAPLKVI